MSQLQFNTSEGGGGQLIFKDGALIFDCDCCGADCGCPCCCMRLKVTISGFTGPHAWRNGVRIFLLLEEYCYYQWTWDDPENTGGQATIDFDVGVPQWSFYAPPSMNFTTATVAGGCPGALLTGTATAGGKDGPATGTITIECGD